MVWGVVLYLLKSRLVRTGVYVTLAGVIGAGIYAHYNGPTIIERTVEHTKTVVVEVPVLKTKIVTKLFPDPQDKATIAALFAENQRLKLDVTGLTQIIAELKTGGGGSGTTETGPEGVTAFKFHDFRLDLAITGLQETPTLNYDLHQKFKIFTTTGRDKQARPMVLVSVNEVTPNGLVPLTTETTAVFADQTTNHWLVSGRIQAGFGVLFPGVDKGGVIAFQWLKRGRSTSAEDVGFAVLSPVVFVGKTIDYGILPVSFNLGKLPRQPFRDLWVSPFLSRTKVGVILTATF